MSDLIIPAPLWRRFAVSIYDGLLLIGLWAATLLACLPIQFSLHLPAGTPWFGLPVFFVWLAFFGWFWTRGGQTLGMRAWRLQVRRSDGTALRWPVAIVRYAGLLVWLGLVLTPAVVGTILRFPKLADALPHAVEVAVVASIIALAMIALQRFDRSKRLPHDWLSGTEVVLLPQNPSPPTPKNARPQS